MGEFLRNMLKGMMDFLISQGVDPDRAGIVSGLAPGCNSIHRSHVAVAADAFAGTSEK